MTKMCIALVLIMTATVSWAYDTRPIYTKYLKCVAKSKSGESKTILIESMNQGSTLIIDSETYYTIASQLCASNYFNRIRLCNRSYGYTQTANDLDKEFVMEQTLKVGDWEIMSQILQVPTGQSRAVDLEGSIILEDGQTYDLSCNGNLTLDGQGLSDGAG